MTSTYTANQGIEKMDTGDQSGTWGATVNTNMDIIDRAISGVVSITLTGSTTTLTTTDGTLTDGMYRVLVLGDGGDLGSDNTLTISPNDQDKAYLVYNNLSANRNAIFSQGTGANATVQNGETAWIYADGAGSGAAVRTAVSSVKITDQDGDTQIQVEEGGDDDDTIRFDLAGAEDFTMTANTFNILSGSTLNVNSGATIANNGTATGFFTLAATDDLVFGSSTLTLSSGSITGTGSRHVVAAESGTTDDFDTLATTNYAAGSLVFLTADAGDIIHITNAGNFSETWVLSETEPATFMLIGSTWYQLDRKINANLAINGGFRVAQRGATITSPTGTTVTLDRWKYSDQSGTGRVTITQSTTVPNNDFANSLKVDVTTADTSIAAGDLYRIYQYGLGLSCGHIAAGAAGAKDITISFWWRSDSSALSYPAIFCGTFGNGSENRVYPFEFSQTTNATWQFHVVTIPGDTTGTWVRTNAKNCYMAINLAVGSDWHGTNKTWSANYDYSTSNQVNGMGHTGNDFYLAGYKAEIGPIATPFDHRPYAEELSICQAYFWKWFDDGAGSTFGIGGFENATRFVIQLDFPQTMRAEPTVTVSNPTSFKANTQSENNLAMDSLNGNDTSRFGVGLQFACTAGTADEVGRWGVSSTNAAVLLDAEL
jgi:hypothetical protein